MLHLTGFQNNKLLVVVVVINVEHLIKQKIFITSPHFTLSVKKLKRFKNSKSDNI